MASSEKHKPSRLTSTIVDGKWKIIEPVGHGAFAEVFKGMHGFSTRTAALHHIRRPAVNLQSNEEVAVKVESSKAKHPQLAFEAQLYRLLVGGVGISRGYWFGTVGGHNMFVMEMLGSNLEELLERCGHTFSLKTTLMLADQLLSRLEYVHSKGFIHRDIKPENFLMGRSQHSNVVHIVDFGLAKRYMDPRNRRHISYREDKSLTVLCMSCYTEVDQALRLAYTATRQRIGTVRYASINNHLGFEQSRRDDLESLGYMMVYFLKGRLPWQGLIATSGKPIDVAQRKMMIPLPELCEDLPNEFVEYLKYVRALKFDETPNYAQLRTSFLQLFAREGFNLDWQWDWHGVGANGARAATELT